MVLNAYGKTVTDEWLEEYSHSTFGITQRMIWDAVEEFGLTDYCEGYGARGALLDYIAAQVEDGEWDVQDD
jgi:hypothetical protein